MSTTLAWDETFREGTARAAGVVVGLGATGAEYAMDIFAYTGARGRGAMRIDAVMSRLVLDPGHLTLSVMERPSERAVRLGIFSLADRVAVSSREEPDHASDDGDSMTTAALAAARRTPAVAVSRPEAPALTGNLINDVRSLCGLTAHELGDLVGRTERQVHNWRESGPPDDVRRLLEALRTIGLTLVGGLGPEGVRRYLVSGSPSPWQRIKAGQIAEVATDVLRLKDSPAT